MSSLPTSNVAPTTAVFLSPQALKAALEIHQEFLFNDFSFGEERLSRLRLFLLDGRCTEYDDLYLYLYQIYLLRGVSRKRLSKNRACAKFVLDISSDVAEVRNSRTQVVRVDYLLDLDVSGHNSRYAFLDEFAVHSLSSFMNSFMRHIPFKSSVTYIDIGCIAISFCVEIPNPDSLGALYGIENHSDVGQTLVQKRLEMPYWENLLNRYSVKDQHIQHIK